MIASSFGSPLGPGMPEEFVVYFRLSILITSIAALVLLGSFTWAYRRFIRSYALMALIGIICYQLSEIYRSAWALSLPDLPLSWAGLFSLAGNLIFIGICLEPARRKRGRLNDGEERTKNILGE